MGFSRRRKGQTFFSLPTFLSLSHIKFFFFFKPTTDGYKTNNSVLTLYSVRSVAQLCPTLCDPMDCSMPGLPVQNQLPEFTQTYPLSWWCHPTISSSVIPFSSCLQSFPASGSFPKSQFFTCGGQSIEVSASASVLPMNIQD